VPAMEGTLCLVVTLPRHPQPAGAFLLGSVCNVRSAAPGSLLTDLNRKVDYKDQATFP
jgi:hypothetical protein